MFEKDLVTVLANVAVRSGSRGFTFDDLAVASTAQTQTISGIADWLAEARRSGLVEDLGFDDGPEDMLGPRRYRLRAARREANARAREHRQAG